MKRLGILFLLLLAVAGCTSVDQEDKNALDPYRDWKPGTKLVYTMHVGVEDHSGSGSNPPDLVFKREEPATLVAIDEDSFVIAVEHAGKRHELRYAGRMIRNVRLAEEEPNQPPQTTPVSAPR